MIQNERVHILNEKYINLNNDYLIYWMQSAQREDFNHALEYAVEKANDLNKGLIVIFVITNYPEANERHYYFMLEGIFETKLKLEERGINFYILKGNPINEITNAGINAIEVITDCGYTKIQKEWRKLIAEKITCKFKEIETDVIVPVKEVSEKEEYSARTIRPKIKKQLIKYMVKLNKIELKNKFVKIKKEKLSIIENENIEGIINILEIDKSVKKSLYYKGGISEAEKKLKEFIEKKLNYYAEMKNDPSKNFTSNLSPYIHFGQISVLYIALEIEKSSVNKENKESFLEELIVRRELSINFINNNINYDNYNYITYNWAYETLNKHKNDKREYIYTLSEFENYKTHDKYWNQAQKEMVITGKMNGYMRMYWGKKIIEWTENPETAYKYMVYLNNRYEIDGRDANAWTGIAWCFGKHDRAWSERDIFGKIRYMNENGLKRKFDMDEYLKLK